MMISLSIRNIRWRRILSLLLVFSLVFSFVIIVKFKDVFVYMDDNNFLTSDCGIKEIPSFFPFTLIKERAYIDENSVYLNFSYSKGTFERCICYTLFFFEIFILIFNCTEFCRLVHLDLFRASLKQSYLSQVIYFGFFKY